MYLDVAVCLPRDALTIRAVRAVVTHTLQRFGVDDECVADIALAISEACTNVIEHASGDDEYEVQLRVEESRCTLSVRDTGRGFDASVLSGVMARPDSARGRGVAIMKAVMDNVDFDTADERRTVVSLVRDLTLRPDGLLSQLRRNR